MAKRETGFYWRVVLESELCDKPFRYAGSIPFDSPDLAECDALASSEDLIGQLRGLGMLWALRNIEIVWVGPVDDGSKSASEYLHGLALPPCPPDLTKGTWR